jgi:hypothetical protein
VHADRFLFVDATPVNKREYTGNADPALRLYDLDRPGYSQPIPPSTGTHDAVAVRRR